jgi:hypothetical protein
LLDYASASIQTQGLKLLSQAINQVFHGISRVLYFFIPAEQLRQFSRVQHPVPVENQVSQQSPNLSILFLVRCKEVSFFPKGKGSQHPNLNAFFC